MSSLILLRLVPFYNLYQRYTLLYMSLCSVLRKVAAGTYIGGLDMSDISIRIILMNYLLALGYFNLRG